MAVFEAQSWAKEPLTIKRNGETYDLKIRVLDFPTWQEYERLTEEAQKLQEELANAEKNPDKATKADVDRASATMDSMYAQLKLLVPDIEYDDLEGFSFGTVGQILRFCVEQASSAMTDKRDPSKKKRASARRSTRSRSPGRG